ncbi:hypothetical protein POX_e06614 [Penicillium oxalicum]|uniref:hypothetical protein n=1 Tax=Penicillium oxalicum TaxID=69781 RepID=UPI0020B643AC|nr:hypothetical protein POX_e06614 [Penicillium oxalicum]KAI2788594.1 hypothetical protein POX_e06614 [Penicillium oxalicum]
MVIAHDAMPEPDGGSLIPAHLSYLAIYNPTLGTTDETLEEQIVFYTSGSSDQRPSYLRDVNVERHDSHLLENDKNDMLRQVGLAQGMVSFANNFSSGKPLECIETDKTRTIILELEKDWWIVASIRLTRLPLRSSQPSPSSDSEASSFRYSAKELGPAQFLIQQLRRAHSIFLLLHDFSMAELYERVEKPTFKLFLERFWEKFTWNWELLLAGNPIVDMYNGIKLAAGGELGMGVGEERKNGAVEKEKFGDAPGQIDDSRPVPSNSKDAWLGSGNTPRPPDGVIFSGIGAIDRGSLARISHWMEWIYRDGDTAFGVRRDPASPRRRHPRRSKARTSHQRVTSERTESPGIPRPLIMAAPQPIPESQKENNPNGAGTAPIDNDQKDSEQTSATDTVMKYLTLGYGSAWSFSNRSNPVPSAKSPSEISSSAPNQNALSKTGENEPQGNVHPPQASETQSEQIHNQIKPTTWGRFLLGPRDDLDCLDDLDEGSPEPVTDLKGSGSRIVHRSVHIRLADSLGGVLKKLQAVIYVHQPFVFTFLFDPDTPGLKSSSLYSSIHHQLGPLQKSLNLSTSPAKVASRLAGSETGAHTTNDSSTYDNPIYDFIYDSSNLTIRSSVPNIPVPGDPANPQDTPSASGSLSPSPSASPFGALTSPSLSRLESLSIHERLLSTYIETRSRSQELERTYKVNRGWWIVWMRIPHKKNASDQLSALSTTSSSIALSKVAEDCRPPGSRLTDQRDISEPHEAFVIRKASDYNLSPAHARMSSGARFFRDLGGVSSSKLTASREESMPSKLAEGLGMDARRYVEGLMSLNR